MSLTGENLVGLFSCNESSRLYLYVHKMVIKGNQTQMSNKKARSLDLQGFLFFCCSVKAGYSLLLLITVLRSKPFVQRQSFFFLHYDKIGTVH